jgi:pimeloyl-ACP methyl ester carboxylesterase
MRFGRAGGVVGAPRRYKDLVRRASVQTVVHDGRTTAYRRTDYGSGRPVVFVHGSGATHKVWTAQYGRRANEYPAVAVDLSGHGESDDVDTDPGPETLAAYAADVAAVAREVGAEVLVGNSLGGAVVLELLLEGGYTPSGIVLAGTGATLAVHEDLRELLAADFETAVEFLHDDGRLFHDPDPDHVEQSKAAMGAVGQAVTRRDFLSCHTFDVRERLSEIDVPTLAVVGEHDALTPPSYHEYLAEEIPDATLVRINGAAHLAMIEQPAAFNGALDMFLGRL